MYFAMVNATIITASLFILSSANQDKINLQASKNSTSSPSSSLSYCSKQTLLETNKKLCRSGDYCCITQVYENQYINEIKSPFINNLMTCRNTCRTKLPPLNACTRANSLFDKYRLLNICYNACFASAYNCPSVYYNYNPTSKSLNAGEISLVVIILVLFACCICKPSSFVNCCFASTSIMRSPSSSKIHIARTSDNNFYDV
jgi:hypothetical protein